MPKLGYYFEVSKSIQLCKAAPKVINYLKYKYLKRRKITSVRRYAPQIGSLMLTKRCNLNCGYCNVSKMFAESKESWQAYEATLEKVKDIIKNPLFAKCIVIDLLGGEPLIVKEFDLIVDYLSKQGYLTNTSTNGLLLAERILDLKKAGITRINLSLYDENRKKLEKELPAINKIFPVHSSYVLLRSEIENNPEKIMESARFVRDAGCLSLRFWMYRPMGTDPKLDEITTDTNPAYIDLKRRLDSLYQGFCFWPQPVKSGKIQKLCPQLWQRVGCDMAGNMYICCGSEEILHGPGSKLFFADPDMVFNHPVLVDMRDKLLNKDSEPPEICKTCNLLGEPGW